MTKKQKELQRYLVKWVLMGLAILLIITGIVGYFKEVKDPAIIYVMLAEVFSSLMVFFGFHMKTKVSEDD